MAGKSQKLDDLAVVVVSGTALGSLLGILPGGGALKLDCEPAPLILGFILGPLMEENLKRAMLMSDGDAGVFFVQPINVGFLLASAALLVVILSPSMRRKRDEAMQECP